MASTSTASYSTGANAAVNWDYAQHNSAYYGALTYGDASNPPTAAMGQINWQSSYPAQMAPAMNQLFPSFARNSTQKVSYKLFDICFISLPRF